MSVWRQPVMSYYNHTHTHTHTQPFNRLTAQVNRVGRYQKKHSPTHTHPDHWTSFINFLHLWWSIASSVFSLRGLTVLFDNLSPGLLWSSSWSWTLYWTLSYYNQVRCNIFGCSESVWTSDVCICRSLRDHLKSATKETGSAAALTHSPAIVRHPFTCTVWLALNCGSCCQWPGFVRMGWSYKRATAEITWATVYPGACCMWIFKTYFAVDLVHQLAFSEFMWKFKKYRINNWGNTVVNTIKNCIVSYT